MSQPRFQIVSQDMGGWVRFFLVSGEPTGELGPFLSQCLTQWMREHPDCRVRLIVPMSSNGDTSELHAWYDRTIFPDSSTRPRPVTLSEPG